MSHDMRQILSPCPWFSTIFLMLYTGMHQSRLLKTDSLPMGWPSTQQGSQPRRSPQCCQRRHPERSHQVTKWKNDADGRIAKKSKANISCSMTQSSTIAARGVKKNHLPLQWPCHSLTHNMYKPRKAWPRRAGVWTTKTFRVSKVKRSQPMKSAANMSQVPTLISATIPGKSVQCAESAPIQHKSEFFLPCLHLLLRAGDAWGEEPNAGLRRRRTHHEAGSKWQQATSAPEVQDFRHLCISFQSENLTRKCFN